VRERVLRDGAVLKKVDSEFGSAILEVVALMVADAVYPGARAVWIF
jgi:hypothetical protein